MVRVRVRVRVRVSAGSRSEIGHTPISLGFRAHCQVDETELVECLHSPQICTQEDRPGHLCLHPSPCQVRVSIRGEGYGGMRVQLGSRQA